MNEVPAMTDFRAGGHYHGPDGLNGRVRDGNGCGPASIVAGEPDGGRRSPPAASSGTWSVGRSRRRVPVRGPRFFGVVVVVADQSLAGRVSGLTRHFREAHATPTSDPPGGEAGGSGWSSRLAVRTGRLRRSPAVHSRPIDLVVFQEPLVHECTRKPRLGGGFALRCLQRLSGPDLATRRCPERDSRYTRGRSSPILSY